MGLGFLLYMFIVIVVISVVGLIMLFTTKNKSIYTAVFIVLALLSIFVSYMNFVGPPSNYIVTRTFGAIWGLTAIIALILQFVLKKNTKTARYLLVASIVLGVWKLLFI